MASDAPKRSIGPSVFSDFGYPSNPYINCPCFLKHTHPPLINKGGVFSEKTGDRGCYKTEHLTNTWPYDRVGCTRPLAHATIWSMKTYKLGPKMTALTDKQREFVLAVFTAQSHTEAYRLAFPGVNDETARTNAARLMRSEKVIEAINEEARKRPSTLLPIALRVLEDTMKNPKDKDRLAAAKQVIGMAGLGPVNITEVRRTDTPAEKVKAIASMLGTLKGLGVTIDLDRFLPKSLTQLAPPEDETVSEETWDEFFNG